MSQQKPFRLYSNRSRSLRANQQVPADVLRQQVEEFYAVYHPAKGTTKDINEYLKYARSRGVLALKRFIKQRYGVNFDEADNSPRGWLRVQQNLEKYFTAHQNRTQFNKKRQDPKTLAKIFLVTARKKGLYILDKQLKDEYGQSLSEYLRLNLVRWKQTWGSVINDVHSERVTYELKRFYNVICQTPQRSKKRQNVPTKGDETLKRLAEFQLVHSRDKVNERLLKKYNMCLDDVTMIKGATPSERKANLQRKLTEFYQKYDPDSLLTPRTPTQKTPPLPSAPLKHYLSAATPSPSSSSILPSPLSSPFGSSQSVSEIGVNTPRVPLRKKNKGISKLRQYDSTGNLIAMKRHLVETSPAPTRYTDEALSEILTSKGTPARKFGKLTREASSLFDVTGTIVTLTKKQMQEIELAAEKGMVEFEQINGDLRKKFKADLETMAKDKLIERLTQFYAERDVEKDPEKIEQVAVYGFTRGLHDMNEKLFVAHGAVVEIDDLID